MQAIVHWDIPTGYKLTANTVKRWLNFRAKIHLPSLPHKGETLYLGGNELQMPVLLETRRGVRMDWVWRIKAEQEVDKIFWRNEGKKGVFLPHLILPKQWASTSDGSSFELKVQEDVIIQWIVSLEALKFQLI